MMDETAARSSRPQVPGVKAHDSTAPGNPEAAHRQGRSVLRGGRRNVSALTVNGKTRRETRRTAGSSQPPQLSTRTPART